LRYAKRGRPKKGEGKAVSDYKVKASFERDTSAIGMLLNRKGRFILATNDIDREEHTDQQSVERGFRFLKDPWFMVDSIFLKLPRRVEALMMIMTLCLMVYNIGQYKLRQKLEESQDTLPNQLGKEIKNPTLRWVFQIMEGIALVRFCDASLQGALREVIANLNKLRRKIITLFGETTSCMYWLIQRNSVGV